MKFNKEDINYFNKKDIPIDNREYSTSEVFKLLDFVDFNSELRDSMWYFVFGPPISIRWATLEQRKLWSPEIKKEDILSCPCCSEKLQIFNDNRYQYYDCTNEKCYYKSYIIDEAFIHYLIIKDVR